MRKEIKASWVLVTKLETHNNLFLYDDVANDYNVRAYVCKCGHHEIVTGDDIRNEYSCIHCQNDLFFNVQDIKDNMESFIENQYYNKKIKLILNLNYEVGIYKNKVQAIAKTEIPTKINFIEQKIIKEEIVVIGMPYQEVKNKIIRSPFSSILLQLQKLAVNKELFEPFVEFKLSKNEKLKRKQFLFILNHYNLKDLKFMTWTNTHHLQDEFYTIEIALKQLQNNKNFKSVKKALYQNYEMQLDEYKEFNPNFVNLITLLFDDINHIVALLKLDLDHENFNDAELIERFMKFLFTQYSQKQIVDFFTNIRTKNDEYVLRDTLMMYKSLRYYVDLNDEKVNCSLDQIHDNFIEVSQKLEYQNKELVEFAYSDSQLSYLTKIDKYDVKLPQNNHELYAWSFTLKNCLASYDWCIESQSRTVYGFFIESKIIFAVEIMEEKIIQAFRKSNQPLTHLEDKILDIWFKDYINKMN